MAKHSKQQMQPQASNTSDSKGFDYSQYAPTPKKRKSFRTVWIIIGALITTIALLYLLGVWVFSFMFLPNSKISSIDVSFKTADTVEQELASYFEAFSVDVTGPDLNFKVDATSANISADTKKIVQDVLLNVDTRLWPLEIFESHDYSQEISNNLSKGNIGSIVEEKVEVSNQNKQDPNNAHLAWNESQSTFYVESETYGTKIDAKCVEEKISNAIVSMKNSITITSEDYIQPKILKSDDRWDMALKQANTYAKANFKVMIGDSQAAIVNGSVLKDMISVDEYFNVSLNSDKIRSYATDIASACNTVGSERTYTRPNDNKTFTVSGGTYGWAADSSDLAEKIIEAITSGSTATISVNVTQKANSLVSLGQPDWGGRWIDVDLTEQHAYMYNNGNLIWETDIVSGDPTNNDKTPTGVWMINAKRTNETLKGPIKNGTPEWECVVSYWMPFVGNSYGLHDASWQSTFGSSAYSIHNWSHGCVNLPTKKAAEIYNSCQIGDAVVVHY